MEETKGKVVVNQPKQSNKSSKAIMVILIISYILLFIAGVLLIVLPFLDESFSLISDMGICKKEGSTAYSLTIGAMWVALTPTLGYYFATIAPLNKSKKAKIAVAIISTMLLVLLNGAFFVMVYCVGLDIPSHYETSDVWFMPLSMVFASLGIAICYLLTLFKINPDKIKDLKPQKGHGLFGLIKFCFVGLFCLILKLVKAILVFKEKCVGVFILVSTILLTWLVFFAAFIFAILCIAVFVGVIIMYFAGVINWAYTPTKNKNKQIEINDCGTYKVLTHNPYLGSDRYEEVYEEDNGTLWYSRDGGKTVYKK